MGVRSVHRLVSLLTCAIFAAPLLALLAGCGEEDPTGPHESPVLLERSGTLDTVAGATDTIDVVIPAGRTMGAIIETDVPIVLRYGSGQFDVVHSGFGGAFAAIVPQVGTGDVRLLVQRRRPDVVEVDYRVRIVAVNEAPEHGDAHPARGGFVSEWIDPPLDEDVFTFDLAVGDEFLVELAAEEDDVRLTAVFVEPGDVPHYLFLEAGPELARSAVQQVQLAGEQRLVVYSAGLEPDVETEYRFRIVRPD